MAHVGTYRARRRRRSKNVSRGTPPPTDAQSTDGFRIRFGTLSVTSILTKGTCDAAVATRARPGAPAARAQVARAEEDDGEGLGLVEEGVERSRRVVLADLRHAVIERRRREHVADPRLDEIHARQRRAVERRLVLLPRLDAEEAHGGHAALLHVVHGLVEAEDRRLDARQPREEVREGRDVAEGADEDGGDAERLCLVSGSHCGGFGAADGGGWRAAPVTDEQPNTARRAFN